MTGQTTTAASIAKLLGFVAQSAPPQAAVDMDCNDACEVIAAMAERVAAGERLEDILPEYATLLSQHHCCREEFEALVMVVAAETGGRSPVHPNA